MAETKTMKKTTKRKSVKKFVKKVPLFQPGEAVRGGSFEYKMSPECAKNILTDPVTGRPVPGDHAAILVDYVNDQCGLLGTCVSVLVG